MRIRRRRPVRSGSVEELVPVVGLWLEPDRLTVLSSTKFGLLIYLDGDNIAEFPTKSFPPSWSISHNAPGGNSQLLNTAVIIGYPELASDPSRHLNANYDGASDALSYCATALMETQMMDVYEVVDGLIPSGFHRDMWSCIAERDWLSVLDLAQAGILAEGSIIGWEEWRLIEGLGIELGVDPESYRNIRSEYETQNYRYVHS